MQKISLIAAMSENWVIGNGPEIPWKIPGEQKRFKELTMGHTIIMGRKTYQAIGRALPERKTIVLTRDSSFRTESCRTVHSLEKSLIVTSDQEEVFIVGGGEIYKLYLPLADTIYLTIINKNIEGDVLFPHISSEFIITETEEVKGEISYTYKTLKRRMN